MARARRLESAMLVPAATAVSIKRPREIIRGIHLDVTGRELVVRLSDRIRWHHERIDALIAQMKKLRDVEHEMVHDLIAALGRYDSPRTTLERKVREHQERASFLTFVRDHLCPDDTYRLDAGDLRITEILVDGSC
jgi:hypothetical protein